MAIINKETIISAFDDKMTLLQWLKKLEKVLDKSTLASINTIKVANTQYKIVLSFEDGTTIESDIIQLQSEIAGIQLQNGHLIFTLLNGETIDAGLIDVSNLGNTTIYGTFEVADGDATFGANVEVDGTLKVNSNLQVGDTTTNDDELAKLPRTLLTPLDTPTEQKVVGIDTANGQNLLGLGEGLQVENDKIKVGGTITDAEVIENMEGYEVLYTTETHERILTPIYLGICKNGNKLTAVAFYKFKKLEQSVSGGGLIRFTIPTSVANKLYPYTLGGFTNLLSYGKVPAFVDASTSEELFVRVQKDASGALSFGADVSSLSQTNIEYLIRHEVTFLLSDNLAG